MIKHTTESVIFMIVQHLPGIPSEKEVKKDGIDLGEMNKLLLQKIEEQMLYIIEMNKEIKALKEEVKEIKKL